MTDDATRPLITLAPEVRAHMTADQVAAVITGQAGPPVYECVTCREPGDNRTDPTTMIMWIGDDDAAILAAAHTRCAPSEVRSREELTAPGNQPPASPGREDVTYASIAALRGGHTPTITVMPGTDTTTVLQAGDSRSGQLDFLRGHGFRDLDLGNADQPAGPAGWAVRVDQGRLVSIGSGSVRWWTSADRPPMPPDWRQAAKTRREVLVMVVSPGTYPDGADQIDLPDARRALRRAAAEGRVVGAVLPLRGTLS